VCALDLGGTSSVSVCVPIQMIAARREAEEAAAANAGIVPEAGQESQTTEPGIYHQCILVALRGKHGRAFRRSHGVVLIDRLDLFNWTAEWKGRKVPALSATYLLETCLQTNGCC